MLLRILAVAVACLAFAGEAGALKGTGPLKAEGGKVSYGATRYVTDEAYGAACDGTTDNVDEGAFEAAYAALSAAGGGTIVVPAGRTCVIASDVTVDDNVRLHCEPGATIKAKSAGSWTLGMFSWLNGSFVAQNYSPVDGCIFDLNGEHIPAVAVVGAGNSIKNSRFINGDASNGSNWSMVSFGCAGENCEFANNEVACANTSGAKDVGIAANGGLIRGNKVTNCDAIGISITGDTQVVTNGVTVTGTSAVGINSTTVANIRGNTITASGATSKGIYATSGGTNVSIIDNRITASGASTIAIQNDAVYSTVTGNRWQLTAVTGGTDDAIGLYSNGQSAAIVGNVGLVTTSDAQTQMYLGGGQTVAVANNLTKGAYCARPIAGAINVNFSGNRCYAQSTVTVVTTTGWILNGNYLAWLGAGGRTLILAGDDTSTKKFTVDHLNVTGNIISSSETGVSGIETAAISKLCDGGSKINETCTTDNQDSGTGCPGTTGSGHCDAQTFEGMQFVSNHFLFSSGADPAIDLSTGVSSTSGDTWNIVIGENTFDLNTTNGVAMKFPSSNQSKVRNIQVGVNSFVGSTRLLNWTPTMGFDAMTTRYPMPVGGCDNSGTATLIPSGLWSIPATTGAAKGCRPASGSYRYGVLQFAQNADKEAVATLPLTGDANQSYNPIFVRLRFSYVTSSPNTVQWVIRGHCVSAGTDPDIAFSAENGNEAVGENIAGISNADATMLTSYLKLPLPSGCFGGDLLEILVSRDGNDTTGTDNYASDVNLFDAEVVVSINKMSN